MAIHQSPRHCRVLLISTASTSAVCPDLTLRSAGSFSTLPWVILSRRPVLSGGEGLLCVLGGRLLLLGYGQPQEPICKLPDLSASCPGYPHAPCSRKAQLGPGDQPSSCSLYLRKGEGETSRAACPVRAKGSAQLQPQERRLSPEEPSAKGLARGPQAL